MRINNINNINNNPRFQKLSLEKKCINEIKGYYSGQMILGSAGAVIGLGIAKLYNKVADAFDNDNNPPNPPSQPPLHLNYRG